MKGGHPQRCRAVGRDRVRTTVVAGYRISCSRQGRRGGLSMQQLPLTVQTDSRKFVEDLYDFLGTLVRDWRLIAVCVGITLTLAVIYLARVKPVYLASARLLVLQHGGRPLNVANGASNNNNDPITG